MSDNNIKSSLPADSDQQNIQSPPPSDRDPAKKKKNRSHLIRPRWLRVSLKTICWIIFIIILIPVLLYVPPVQTLLKNVACNIVRDKTGMNISIDEFRLKWPVDIDLKGVTIVEATGDTMVAAQHAVVDVKLLPLLKLDFKINKLSLQKGFYRMVSPDSSMILKLKAGLLEVDNQSSADMANSRILLHEATLKDGDVSLMMNVWKQQPTPKDTSSAPFYVSADLLKVENIDFHMSMLPTIDTLTLHADNLLLRKGVIDLAKNLINAEMLTADSGNVLYLVPTPEYIKEHPAPVSQSDSVPSPPMVINADSVSLTRFNALYATKGVEPIEGFDPSYIDLSDINITLHDFYNAASTLELPVTALTAKERSGLQITSGNGLVSIDSTGLALKNLHVTTPWSELEATAGIPFALMELNPSAPLNVNANGSIGLPDIDAFMPMARPYTSKIPNRAPVNFNILTEGTLESVNIPSLSLAIPDVINLKASGNARNPLDMKKMDAAIRFDGALRNPALANSLLGKAAPFKVPDFSINGRASAKAENYTADFSVHSSVGNLAAKGSVGLNSESYHADATVRNVNISRFMPELGIGHITGTIHAQGAGFNPTLPRAHTNVQLDVASVEYNKQTLRNIIADATLNNGNYTLSLISHNNPADFNISGTGTLSPDLYTFDLQGRLKSLNLKSLGLSPDTNEGHAMLSVTGSANPQKWNYDVHMVLDSLEWTVGNQFISLPRHMTADFRSTPIDVLARIDGDRTALVFNSAVGLKPLLDSFTIVGDSVSQQMNRRSLQLAELQHLLPPFSLGFQAGGKGVLGQYLNNIGLHTDTIHARIDNDSIFSAALTALRIGNTSLTADTILFDMKQRGELFDYHAHMGNRPNNALAEFADVNINGYLGTNRLLMSLTQKNQQKQTGYRLGFTGAFVDSVFSIHFTPLKATIAYLPWIFNDDNHVDYNLTNHRINANLMASSNESSIRLMTQTGRQGNDELNVDIKNVHIQDFLRLSVFAPPITASVNSNLTVGYNDNWFYGSGSLGISDFTYDNLHVGDLDFKLRAGLNNTKTSGGVLSMAIDGKEALNLEAIARHDSVTQAMSLEKLGLRLTKFPLKIVNPFLGADIASLSGSLNGDMALTGTFTEPILNGTIACDSVGVFIPMIGSRLSFGKDSITVADNFLRLNEFDIWGANKNPLVINGSVDARHLSAIVFDLDMKANNFQLIGNDKRARSEVYGKVFLDMNASVKGPMQHFSINADATVLPATDVTYSVPQTTAELTQQNAGDVVTFVNFNDSTTATDSVAPQTMAMRILASLTIDPGTQVTVEIPGTTTTGNGKVEISPSGTLRYFQNFMGDMRLNGRLNIGDGFARYSIPIVGEKMFTFNPASYVLWNGQLMDPVLSIDATDKVKASLIENGNSRIVNFLVNLKVTNTLSAPKVVFNLSTDDDLNLQNDLLSMSADQRSTAAINLLLTGQYNAQGARTASSDLVQGALYGVLTSQLNSWMANHVRGVDLTFGVDQFDKTTNGQSGTSTSYSYQLSKSLFDNKFKISVGGNYTTDASADENFSENLISDISFEYILKQTANVTMYGRLFRHTGYESVLEGEITETGLGFVLKRRLASLRNLFNFGFGRGHKSDTISSVRPDSAARKPEPAIIKEDNDSSINDVKK